MTFEELSKQVLEWASEKGILIEDSEQAVRQSGKMVEEVEELVNALIGVHENKYDYAKHDDYYYESELELGDVLVTVIITAYCAGLNPINSLQKALNKITKRSGKLVNGIFVKD